MNSTFTNLILDVENMDRSLRFYHDLLHFPVKSLQDFEGHRVAYLSTGSTEILLVQQPQNEQNPTLERPGAQVMNFRVQNISGLAREVELANIRILRGLEMAVWGDRTLLVADPDGYSVLLSEPTESLH